MELGQKKRLSHFETVVHQVTTLLLVVHIKGMSTIRIRRLGLSNVHGTIQEE